MQQKLDTFTRAYIHAALWTETDEEGEFLDSRFSADDFAPDAIEKIKRDCEIFQSENDATLRAAIELGVECGPDFDEWGRAGHDFWLTRNGHGAGFWDGDWPEPHGEALTEAAKAHRECNIYIGDDGKLYVNQCI